MDSGPTADTTISGERGDLLRSLQRARRLLRHTVRGLSTEEASRRTTVSALTLAGLIKHVAFVERSWAAFAVGGIDASRAVAAGLEEGDDFRLESSETLDGLLTEYEAVAVRTDELVQNLPSLNVEHVLPTPEGELAFTARRAFMHITTETAQHAGHADIIRESLDGATSEERA